MTGTWNPSDNYGLTLSNSNLTATNSTGSGVWYTCRSTPYFEPTNKVYAEFTATNVGVSDSAVYVAVMTGTASLSLPGLYDSNSVGYNENGSTTYNGSGPTLATWTTGNVVCVAVDGNNNKIWWRVNNGNWMNDGSATANPATNTGGISCPNIFNQGPVYFGVSIHTVNYAVTANFNGTFSYTVPSGFAALPPLTSTPGNPIFAFGQIGSLSAVISRQLSGVTGSASVGAVLPTTSAINSIGATGQTASLAVNSLVTLASIAAQGQASFGSLAEATTIYNYDGFDYQNTQLDLAQGIIKTFMNCTASLNTKTPYNIGNSLAVTVNGGASSTAGYCIYNSGPFAIPRASLGVMTQSTIYSNLATDVGFTLGTSTQVFCRMMGNILFVYLGNPSSPTLLGTYPNVIPAVGWFYIEISVVIAPSNAGSISIFINGSSVVSLSGITTSATGVSLLDGIFLGGLSPSATNTTYYFDDVYLATSQLGPIRISTLRPTANGTVTQFLTFGQPNSTNWQEVSDIAMDADASYTYSNNYAALDEFVMSDLPSTANAIVALKVVMAARKDLTNTRSLGTVVLSNAATSNGMSNALTTTYQYYWDIYLLDPNTSSSWTASGINAAQMGYKIR